MEVYLIRLLLLVEVRLKRLALSLSLGLLRSNRVLKGRISRVKVRVKVRVWTRVRVRVQERLAMYVRV
jgi:hypothetical protein